MLAHADTERERLQETAEGARDWRRWGPYLSERQWGTVREDYSPNGDAWGASHMTRHASRAYRWGEDGLLGISDDSGLMCFALALWNGRDPILKERLFGVTNPEGNHGEDVKECYYYLDALPTASYLRGLYKYPQAPFPYQQLIDENGGRSRQAPEFNLTDTGVFDGDRYFDVTVEYAKDQPDDICIRIIVANRGRDDASLDVLPTLWFRNTWSWNGGYEFDLGRPSVRLDNGAVTAEHSQLGTYTLVAAPGPDGTSPDWLFTENETNAAALYGDPNGPRYAKDAFHQRVIHDDADAVTPEARGTKAAAWYRLVVPGNGSVELRLRLSHDSVRPALDEALGRGFEEIFERRVEETDEFYADLARPDDAAIVRQAAAGLIWSKQFYYYGVRDWLTGDPSMTPPSERRSGRNTEWEHVFAHNVISMPDKWEFPWFAAWDLAFHMLPFSLIDPAFAQRQLLLMLSEQYMHPNGQLAAYEYNFGDVNPPVHAWACMHLYRRGKLAGTPDTDFLKRAFHKLLLNFTWWVNRKDAEGRNLFGGGFLGLDNIGVFDRSSELPPGITLEQADGTAWMGLYCTSMLSMAMELAREDPAYEDVAVKFLEHFITISQAINAGEGDGLWDDVDGFYYDHLRRGTDSMPLRVRSLVGLLPLVGAAYYEGDVAKTLPEFSRRIRWAVDHVPGFAEHIQSRDDTGPDGQPIRRWLIALPPRERLQRLLQVMLDEEEFLSPHGVRSMSRYHEEHPYVLEAAGQRIALGYVPAESDSSMFGGNSNWRGPIWFPLNTLILEALLSYDRYYGDSLQVEYPTGSGNQVPLRDVALGIAERLVGMFRPGPDGARPIHGADRRYADDPHWRELLLFNEYFDGDSGRGCGASHRPAGRRSSWSWHTCCEWRTNSSSGRGERTAGVDYTRLGARRPVLPPSQRAGPCRMPRPSVGV